jgi:hypothetical protein
VLQQFLLCGHAEVYFFPRASHRARV